MSRKDARKYVYQLIFGYMFTKERDEENLKLCMLDTSLTGDDTNYIQTVYDGVLFRYEELKEIVEKYSRNFSVDRIYKPDLAALLLAIYEMTFIPDIPSAVSISSVVEIVKQYSTEKSKVFVNGLLASYYKDIEESRNQ